MKGLNVKRIAALAAGAAILGATLATAGAVTYSNTPIISAEGVPQVKIVVGERAAASDGVAAANIAAVIGNLAFKSQEVTATVSGAANLGCTVTGGAGAGTCAVTNEKVTLEVTVPGTVGGVYPFNTYINDWVDKKLQNRLFSTVDDVYNTSLDLSPFANDVGEAGKTYAVKKITSAEFPALASPTVTDPYANKQYKEEQTLWFQAHGQYDTLNKKLAATDQKGAYQIEFTHDQAGIPVGTCDATVKTNLDSNYQNDSNVGDYTKCPEQDMTDRHRVHIGFLGDTYIISQMNPPTDCELTSPTSECPGGSINLAKESAYGIVHVGENLTAGAYVLKLVDIEAPLGNGKESAATIAIYDSTGSLLKEDKFYPSTSSYTWTAPDGSKVRIRVYKTNPGYYAYAKWAEMAVYSQEFTLTSGESLDTTDNSDWVIKLAWRNKDPTYASKEADALRKIILYDNYADPTQIMGTGDTYDFVTKPVAYQIEFGGITLGAADYDSLSLSLVYYGSASFPVQTDYDAGCSQTTTINNTNGNLLQVQSLVKDAFQLSGHDTFLVQRFYYFLGNETSYGSPVTGLEEGMVIFQKPGGSCYYYMNASVYYLAGDATSDDMPIWYDKHDDYDTNTAAFWMQESASSSSGVVDVWEVPIYRDTDNKDKFLLTTTATKQIYYNGVTGIEDELEIGRTTVEPGYISERGTQFVDMSTYGVSFKRARRLGELKFFAKTKGTEATTGTTVGPLGEGETANVGGGVTVKVKEITETVGTCTVGGDAQCTVTGKDGLSATPSVTRADVRVPLNTAANKLVVLDKDADTSATLIVVGGNLVNTVAAEVIQSGAIDLSKDRVVVKAVGTNRILVAGYTAADTLTAADQFIQALIAAAQ
ncbi:MAG: S-layer protein [Candidatus Micrarchaeia archaeon]